MSTAYPRFSTWRDIHTGDYEVVRWDSALDFQAVQTNIRTREKAIQARADWQARAAQAKEQP